MYRYFLIVCIAITILGIESVYALVSPEKVIVETRRCMDARDSQTESTITEYICPSGSFYGANKKPISREVLACSIRMALEFSEIDTDAMKWVTELQKRRDRDPLKWNEEIQQKIYGKDGLANRYVSVCQITKWKECVETTDFYPETSCEDKASAKATAWKNMGYILAGKGIAKGFQNDKDTYIDSTKWAYTTLVQKWNEYKRIVDKAVSKFTAYIKNAVK